MPYAFERRLISREAHEKHLRAVRQCAGLLIELLHKIPAYDNEAHLKIDDAKEVVRKAMALVERAVGGWK